MMWLYWFAVLSLTCGFARAELDNETSPTHQFKSRPDIHAPIIDMTILRPELVLPGYLFLAPYRNLAPGPYIYDNYGELVWAGAGSSGPKVAHIPHVCDYKGEDHLCFFQGDQHHGYARGFGVIMDNRYRIVKTVDSSGSGASSDMHEFRLTPFSHGKSVLNTVYQPRAYDLTVNPRFNLRNGIAWVNDGVFQEVEIDTGRILFEWRSLDHVDPSLSWVMPGSTDTSGNGLDTFTPWDYFHINSIDKNQHGDYLISARHTSAIYKLSGTDGHIIWQLGGNNPSFEQDFVFSFQHDARWMSENKTHTVLSFFDNASNSYNETAEFSRGVIVAINHVANTASLVKEWGAPEPDGGLRSGSQGNMQLLPNGGCHIGWGEHAHFSEHTSDGNAVMYGKLASRESNVMIYRSHKFNWTAHPLTKPTLWTYSKTGEDQMRFYASWNGATEVTAWEFFTAALASGPYSSAGRVRRSGFETEFHSQSFESWAYVEALDVNGKVLGRSTTQYTFVPSPGLIDACDDRGCAYAELVPEEEATPYEAHFDTDDIYLSSNRGFDTGNYYTDTSSSLVSASLSGISSGRAYTSHLPSFGSVVLSFLVLIVFGVLILWYFRRSRFVQGCFSGRTWSGRIWPRVFGRYGKVHEKDDFEIFTPTATSSSSSSSVHA